MKLFTVSAGTPAMLVGDRVLRVWEVSGDRTYDREDLVLDQVVLHNTPTWNHCWLEAHTVALIENMVGKGYMFFSQGSGEPLLGVLQHNVMVLA